MLPKSKESSRAGEGSCKQVILLIHSLTLARWVGEEKVMEPDNNLMKNRKVVSAAADLKDKSKACNIWLESRPSHYHWSTCTCTF